MKIDFHAHAFPGEFFETVDRLYPGIIKLKADSNGNKTAMWADTPLPSWEQKDRIQEMNKSEVSLQILSNPPIYNRMDENSPKLCRMMNDMLANYCKRDPDRFKAFAHLPFNDMNLALKEMRRTIDELGFVGVLITSNIAGKYLHTPDYEPFWEEVNRKQICVFMHPTLSPCYCDDAPATMLSFPSDTTLSAYKLIQSGLFERHPDIILVLAHLGGTLPYLAHRINIIHDHPIFYGAKAAPAVEPIKAMRKLYLDTALGWSRGSFNCARELVGLEHIVFGSDHFLKDSPFADWTSQFIDGLGLKRAEREMIYFRNAMRILKLKA